METRNRKSEFICPNCGGNCLSVGGYPSMYKDKIMHKQYRKCKICDKKIVTYKDFSTGEMYYNDKLVSKATVYKHKDEQ